MTNEEIVIRIQNGKGNKNELLSELYAQNERLINGCCNKYRNLVPLSEIDDLKQESYFGLIDAVEKFDRNKEYPFIPLAKLCISSALMRYYSEHMKAIRIPTNRFCLINKYNKEHAKFSKENNRFPTDAEMSIILNLPIEKIRELKKESKLNDISSLCEKIEGGHGEATALINFVPDESTDIESNYIKEELFTALWEEVDKLDEDCSSVIKKRYIEEKTAVQIAEEDGIARQTVCNNERKAIRKLKRNLRLLQLITDDDIRNQAVSYSGIGFYKRTGNSSVEWAILKMEHMQEKTNNVQNKIDKTLPRLCDERANVIRKINPDILNRIGAS